MNVHLSISPCHGVFSSHLIEIREHRPFPFLGLNKTFSHEMSCCTTGSCAEITPLLFIPCIHPLVQVLVSLRVTYFLLVFPWPMSHRVTCSGLQDTDLLFFACDTLSPVLSTKALEPEPCFHCQKSLLNCDGFRPCHYCIRRDLVTTCTTSVRRKEKHNKDNYSAIINTLPLPSMAIQLLPV
ncbi:hypothetical protein BDF14DRAFT_441284 [Spinellus fusiger]|nr:hypothetical protein BDF14DRAFT_441284 [Spinellus fusiger]